jgi:hypothetical protein
MSKIQLNAASGGGSVAFEGPASVSSDKIIKFPNSHGVIVQVQSVTVNSAVSATNSGVNTFADISGMSVNITPTSATNKMFICYNINFGNDTSDRNALLRIVKDGSVITAGNGATGNGSAYFKINTTSFIINNSNSYLDTAGGTSQITYKMQWSSEASGVRYMNRRGSGNQYGTISTFTVMEVAV